MIIETVGALSPLPGEVLEKIFGMSGNPALLLVSKKVRALAREGFYREALSQRPLTRKRILEEGGAVSAFKKSKVGLEDIENMENRELEQADKIARLFFTFKGIDGWPQIPEKVMQLEFVGCYFPKLPPQLFGLPGLISLKMIDCCLEDVTGIGKLTKLQHLQLHGNPFREMPKEVADLPLRYLSVSQGTLVPPITGYVDFKPARSAPLEEALSHPKEGVEGVSPQAS